MNIKKTVVAMAFSLSLAGYANAGLQQEFNGYPSDEDIKKTEELKPEVAKKMFSNGEKFIKKFDAGFSGFDGWVVQFTNPNTSNIDFMVAYTSKDGENLFVGHVFNAKGESLTGKAEAHIPKQNIDIFKKDLEASSFVLDGNKDGKEFYVFIDPDCTYCHKLWLESRQFVKNVNIKWIPVSILSEGSFAKSAQIIQSKDPFSELSKHENSFESTRGISGLDNKEISLDTANKIKNNTELMKKMKISGTPAIVYKDEGGNLKIINGAPSMDVLEKIMK